MNIKTKLKLQNLLVILSICTIASANAQIQNWNTAGRASSQNLSSAAVNALNEHAISKAVAILINATKQDDNDPLPFRLLGIALAMQGQYDEALAALHKSYELAREGETLVSTGVVYYLNNDPDAAIEAWDKALKLEPKNQLIKADIGFACVKKGDYEQAEACFSNVISTYPSRQIGYFGMALVKYLKGDLAGAMNAARHAQTISPYPSVMFLLAKIVHFTGDDKLLAQLARQQGQSMRKNWRQRSMVEIGYPAQHDFHFDPFLIDSFDNGNLLIARNKLLGNGISDFGKNKQSKSVSSKQLNAIVSQCQQRAAMSNNYLSYMELGLVQINAGMYKEALSSFSQAIRICPPAQINLLYMAEAAFLSGQLKESADYLQAYQKILPGQPLSGSILKIKEFAAEPKATPATSNTSVSADSAAKPDASKAGSVENEF